MMQRVLRLIGKKAMPGFIAADATGTDETCQIRLSVFLITITDSIQKHSWNFFFMENEIEFS